MVFQNQDVSNDAFNVRVQWQPRKYYHFFKDKYTKRLQEVSMNFGGGNFAQLGRRQPIAITWLVNHLQTRYRHIQAALTRTWTRRPWNVISVKQQNNFWSFWALRSNNGILLKWVNMTSSHLMLLFFPKFQLICRIFQKQTVFMFRYHIFHQTGNLPTNSDRCCMFPWQHLSRTLMTQSKQ